RPPLALSAYFSPHIPILLGVVGLAAGLKLTIGHAAQPHPAAQALAIGGGGGLVLARAGGLPAAVRAPPPSPIRPPRPWLSAGAWRCSWPGRPRSAGRCGSARSGRAWSRPCSRWPR